MSKADYAVLIIVSFRGGRSSLTWESHKKGMCIGDNRKILLLIVEELSKSLIWFTTPMQQRRESVAIG